MVKRTTAFVSLFLALMLLLSVTAFADQHVYDNANLFSDDETAQLESMVSDFINSTGCDMYILTAGEDDYYDSLQARADDFLFDKGYGTTENGAVLYLIDMYYRNDHISTAGTMIDYLTDSRISDILGSTNPYLRDGDFAGAASEFITMTQSDYAAGIPEGQYRTSGDKNTFTFIDAAITLVLAAAGFFITYKAVQGQYELKGSTYKYDYLSNSNVAITGRTDQFINTTIIRVPHPKPESGGSDEGSTTHTSSGGGTFGGGSGGGF